MQFLDVKTDFAFKKVFGSSQSKDILISQVGWATGLSLPTTLTVVLKTQESKA